MVYRSHVEPPTSNLTDSLSTCEIDSSLPGPVVGYVLLLPVKFISAYFVFPVMLSANTIRCKAL